MAQNLEAKRGEGIVLADSGAFQSDAYGARAIFTVPRRQNMTDSQRPGRRQLDRILN